MVRVAADWLVVKAATRKIARAIVKGQFSARPPRALTIASSLLAMNVSAIQAIPKRAIIATIPDLKICVLGMSAAETCARTRINAAAESMIIWISGVTDMG